MLALTVAAALAAAATATAAALPQDAPIPASTSGNFTIKTGNCANATLDDYVVTVAASSDGTGIDNVILAPNAESADDAYLSYDSTPSQSILNLFLPGVDPEVVYEAVVPYLQNGTASQVTAETKSVGTGTAGWDITSEQQLVFAQTGLPSAVFLACVPDTVGPAYYYLEVTGVDDAPDNCQIVELFVAFVPDEASS